MRTLNVLHKMHVDGRTDSRLAFFLEWMGWAFQSTIRLNLSILFLLLRNREICTTLARAATALLHAERYEAP